MKSQEEIDREVHAIDTRITIIKIRIERDEELIRKIGQTNDRRYQSLRELGQKRSELLTFELNLDA